MSIALAVLVPAQQLPISATLFYTSPAGVTTRIDSLSVINTTGASVQVTIYLAPAGQAAGASNETTSAQSVLPGQTWNSPNEIGKVLAPGDALYAFASEASALTIAAAGIQST